MLVLTKLVENNIVYKLFCIMQAKLSPKDVPPASPEPMADIREEEHEDQSDSDNDSISLEDDAFKCK